MGASGSGGIGRLRFVDLFAGLGGFHLALRKLGHECVFASEIDTELRDLYVQNFPGMDGKVFGDIRTSKDSVPAHDVLCAGFPCQPFSKSGTQEGLKDLTRGTVFHEVAEILQRQRPTFVLLENVGNFERHDRGRTWDVVRRTLIQLGYDVRGTTHLSSGGHGLISPHHLGFPHNRERFFIVASRSGLPTEPFPPMDRRRKTELSSIVQPADTLTPRDLAETSLTEQQVRCIEHWNRLLQAIPGSIRIQSPIWGDELRSKYPFEDRTPFTLTPAQLRDSFPHLRTPRTKGALMQLLPSYARSKRKRFPKWKVEFIRQNRDWFREIRPYIPEGWTAALWKFPSSLRKLEWNRKGDARDLWTGVLQFRPSGLRAKRYVSSPSLVAMTATQIPILGPERRSLTRVEGLRLQGFPDTHRLPRSRHDAFTALGNAVHVGVATAIARRLLSSRSRTLESYSNSTSRPDEKRTSGRPDPARESELIPLLAALRGEPLH